MTRSVEGLGWTASKEDSRATKVNWKLENFPMSVFPLYLVTRCVYCDLVPS
jgi:hypothetical protein